MNYILSVDIPPESNNYKAIKIIPSIKINQLDQKIEADEAPSLIAENLIEYFPIAQEDEILDALVVKTRLGGELIVSILNGKKIIWQLTEGNFQDANAKLFGVHEKPVRNLCFNLPAFIAKLESRGLKVLQVLEQDAKNIIKCQKLR